MTVWLWWWSKVHTFWHEKIHLEAKCSKKPCSVLLGSCAPHGYRAWNRLMKFNAESLKECCPIVKGCPFVKIQENKSLEIGSWKRASHTPTRASYLSQLPINSWTKYKNYIWILLCLHERKIVTQVMLDEWEWYDCTQ